MRLIDADAFIEDVCKNCKDTLADLWCELIRRQPVVYDVDKVIEKISLLQENAENSDLNTYMEKAAYNTAYFNCIETVKSGDREELEDVLKDYLH